MVAKKTAVRRSGKKLRVRRETLRDLESPSGGKKVKAGKGQVSDVCTLGCIRTMLVCKTV